MKTSDINKFLQSLDEAEFIYINHIVSISLRWRNIINELGITREEFCKKMEIKEKDYDKFIRGADYSLRHIASFESLHATKLIEKRDADLKKEVQTFTFPEYKDSKKPSSDKNDV